MQPHYSAVILKGQPVKYDMVWLTELTDVICDLSHAVSVLFQSELISGTVQLPSLSCVISWKQRKHTRTVRLVRVLRWAELAVPVGLVVDDDGASCDITMCSSQH